MPDRTDKTIVHDARPRPWSWFDNGVIREYGATLGPYGISVYMGLLTYTNNQHQCYPSYATLAKLLGMSRRKVIECVQQLEGLGLIRVEHRSVDSESGQPEPVANLYTLLSPWAAPLSDPSAPATTPSAQEYSPGNGGAPEEKQPEKQNQEVPGFSCEKPGATNGQQRKPDKTANLKRPPPSRQAGEVHPDVITAIQRMVVQEFHCLAEPTLLNERFWDAQIEVVERRKANFYDCLTDVDSYYAAHPEKWPRDVKSARARMRHALGIALDKAERRARYATPARQSR